MAETPEPKAEEQDEHQHSWLGDVVRQDHSVVVYGHLTANYLGIFPQSVDPTFPGILLTGTRRLTRQPWANLARNGNEDNGVIVDNKDTKAGIK